MHTLRYVFFCFFFFMWLILGHYMNNHLEHGACELMHDMTWEERPSVT